MKKENGSVLLNNPSPRCWRTRPLPQGARKTARGFTLIELLVVVLIIGILAAVAVPQYKMAVAKSRLATVIPVVNSAKHALDLYYLAHGDYPIDTADDVGFDFTVPAGCTKIGSTASNVCDNGNVYDIMDYEVPLVTGINVPSKVGYIAWANVSDHPNARWCIALATDTVANNICKSMGGIEIEDNNRFGAFKGRVGVPTIYKLP